MEYTVNQLASLSGVSKRTLRYYDAIGLLAPRRAADNGYRLYGPREVDRLQQILFYRALGVPLEAIGRLLSAPDFDREKALEAHLSALLEKRAELEALIGNVTKTICAMKGETMMTDQEKFEGFKQKMLSDNEDAYGDEIRSRYGDEAVDASYAKVAGMSEEQWQKSQALSAAVNQALKEAFDSGDPACEAAMRACDLHRQWLCLFWKDGTYSKEAHKGLAEMYAADPRFAAYYDRIAPGCARFFRDAIAVYCS